MKTFGLLAACLLSTTPNARAGDPALTPTRLLLGPGSVVPGSPVGSVAFSPQRVVYGDTGWTMNVTMDDHIEMIVSETGIGVYQGQELPGGDTVNDLWLSVDSDPSGRVAALVFLDDGDVTAVTIDDTVALREGDVVSAAGLEAGSKWSVPESATFDATGHLAVLGLIVEPSGPGVPIDAIVRYDVDARGNLSHPVVLLSEHDIVAGHTISSIGYITDLTFAHNAAGQLLTTLVFGAGGLSGHPAIVLDGVVLAEHGTPSPIPDRNWIVSQADPVALNAQGDYAFRTRIEAGVGNGFDVIVHNGAIVAIEGTPVPGVPNSTITRLHAPRLADDGTLLYLVEWSQGPLVTRQGFIVNDHLAVATLATQIEGETLAGLHNDALEYDLSPDGTRFSFVGYTAFGGWGAYEAPTGPWQDETHGLAGTGGVAPTLFGLGSLEPASVMKLQLAGAVPGSQTNLVIGLSHLGAPFHGGVMVPKPDVVLFGLPVNAAGKLNLSGALPGGLPSSLPLHFQFWTADVGGPAGFSASNGLVGLTP